MNGEDGTPKRSTPEATITQSPHSDPDATLNTSQAPTVLGARDLASKTPDSIGPYHLLRRLGEGGMGQVWLAEQTEPVRRTVALKLIRVGMYDDEVLQRFRSERQSLAMMDHPAIAKVFDAGATRDGQPYFVMEYVPGIPITDYCDQQKLPIKERLELFIKVCEGVQHAHQKAVIHRDLKPANILVSEVDGKPMPRIIDFGLAKATGSGLGDETVMTRAGGFVGTPGYMSPEQADPTVHDIDTRTDVYSLGVVLYVLLTGGPPFDSRKWRTQPLHDMLRQLREVDPPRPSTKIRSQRLESSANAELRGVQSDQLVHLLHGDLDWITMKALEKDRDRRYPTPIELAADINRYLRNEPVVARPASTVYRLQKYIRRHRAGVVVATALVLLLVGFAVMQAIQFRRVTRERDRANRITDFISGMFKVSDPSQARGNSITVREVLDKASKQIEAGLSNDPETQAKLMGVMAGVYHNLGLYPQAEPLWRHAVDINRRTLGLKNPQTLESMASLAALLADSGHDAEAEKLDRETLDLRRRFLGGEHPDTLASMRSLSMTLVNEGHYPEAEKLAREVLEIQRRKLGSEDPATVRTVMFLAVTLNAEGRYAEAETLAREAVEIQRRVLGPDHPNTLRTMSALADSLEHEGKYPEAEELGRQTLELDRHVFGPKSPDTLGTMANLAGTLYLDKRYSEAEKLARETLDATQQVLGPEHLNTLQVRTILFAILAEEGKHAEAEKLGRETLGIQRRALGPEHPETALTLYNLGGLAALQGHKDEALTLLREAVDHGLTPSMDLALETDPDHKILVGDPRFAALVAHAKQKATAAQKQN